MPWGTSRAWTFRGDESRRYDRKSQTCYFKTCAPPRTDGDERFESYAKASTCVARAPPARVSKRAAVVVAVRDAADYAARCVEALWRSADARGPSRDALFIVNDASSAATLKRLGALVAARKRDAPLPATLVNWDGAATLDGYTRAANLGLEAARDAGPFDACFRRVDFLRLGRGDAAAATWTFRGDASRRRRDVDIFWRRDAALRRGHSAETRRGDAAT